MTQIRTWLGLAVVGVSLGLASQLGAQPTGPALTISGKISSVDAQQNILRLEAGLLNIHEFVVEDDTTITDGQQPLELEQLQPEAKATVEYVQDGDKKVAQSITVERASAQTEPITPGSGEPEMSPPTMP